MLEEADIFIDFLGSHFGHFLLFFHNSHTSVQIHIVIQFIRITFLIFFPALSTGVTLSATLIKGSVPELSGLHQQYSLSQKKHTLFR